MDAGPDESPEARVPVAEVVDVVLDRSDRVGRAGGAGQHLERVREEPDPVPLGPDGRDRSARDHDHVVGGLADDAVDKPRVVLLPDPGHHLGVDLPLGREEPLNDLCGLKHRISVVPGGR